MAEGKISGGPGYLASEVIFIENFFYFLSSLSLNRAIAYYQVEADCDIRFYLF